MATVTLSAKRSYEDGQDESPPLGDDSSGAETPRTPPKKARKLGPKDRTAPPSQTQTQPALEQVGRTLKDVALGEYISLQIVTGSYDRGILHGITAEVPSHTLELTNGSDNAGDVKFSDSFLFAAHTSSIRALGISDASETGKRILATGGSDERINLYTLSTIASPRSPENTHADKPSLPSLVPSQSSSQNPKNRSLGNLVHHDRPVTRLYFPPNSNKLFSSSEDNNIAITRTRDWTLLSSIRAPIPKPTGRPSGDTAGPGEVPAGVNDFAIHPSQKLMLSVGRGERCLRLWNLMTGKKAGVLNFDREVLLQAGEGKYSSGEGRRVLWSESGEAYGVVFERGAVVYGLDSKARAVIRPSPPTKLHQVRMLPKLADSRREVLTVSTEDARILFFDLTTTSNENANELPSCHCFAQLGGRNAGMSGRVKDFDILPLPQPVEALDITPSFLVVSASSDGAVRIWNVSKRDMEISNDSDGTGKQVGNLVGTVETGNRITCLGAFVMEGRPEMVRDELSEDGDANGIVDVEDESDDDGWDGFDAD